MIPINILLVDDEELFRQGLRSLLEKEPFVKEIYEAGNATEFEAQMLQHRIDLILLDMKLPGTRGYELLRNLSDKDTRPKCNGNPLYSFLTRVRAR